jgi:hypothetical protein
MISFSEGHLGLSIFASTRAFGQTKEYHHQPGSLLSLQSGSRSIGGFPRSKSARSLNVMGFEFPGRAASKLLTDLTFKGHL